MKFRRYSLLVFGLIGTNYAQAASVITFDDLDLAPNSYWSGQIEPGSLPVTPSNNTFTSGNATFSNQTTDWGGGFTSWSGWSYSNMTDNVTPGFGNQYSVYSGQAFSGSQFGVAYVSGNNAAIAFDEAVWAGGFYATNTTYTALSMLNGDAFSKKFGGEEGTDQDWLKLSIQGVNGGDTIGQVDFYLADYRNGNSHIVSEWEWVDLSSLGLITGLTFSMSSTDQGAFGMNTPAYFAMDNLTVTAVPLPAAIWLMGSGLLALLGFNRRSSLEV